MKRAALLSVLFLVLLILSGSPAQAQSLYSPKKFLRFKTGSMAKVGSALAQLQEEHAAALKQGLSAAFTPSNSLLRVSGGQVSIEAVTSGDTNALRADLEALGLQKTATFGRMVSGLLPIGAIGNLAALSSLQFARPAYMTTHVGSVTSQGDAAMNADDARTTFGVDGTGVTVGTLSDSFDCLQALDPMTPGADADVASGDLPAGIIVLEDVNDAGCIDEGRAMMQLIADVAPGAAQAFHTAQGGQANFALGIQELAGCPHGSEMGCTPDPNVTANIIVDDVIYFAEPMFQDGIIAQAVDTVKRAGVAYFSSAGNNGRDSYQSSFTPTGIPLVFEDVFAHDFDPGPDVDTCQSITVPMGTTFISFQWNQPFFSVSGEPGSATDLDIFVFAEPTCDNLIFAGGDMNIGADPVELLGFTNPGPAATIGLAIGKFNPAFPDPDPTPDPGLIKYVVSAPNGFSIVDFPTFSSTLYGHANAAGAEAVGAAFFGNTPEFGTDPPLLEPFSSAGPTPILFDTSGAPTFKVRNKPEIVAPDGANTTFFSPGVDPEADGFPNFFGTSAAAPHAAGVAALIKQNNPLFTPREIYSVLETTTIDMDAPGFDFDTGFGFIQASAALLPPADLSVTKSDATDSVGIGDDVVYTITVTNNGPNEAENVVMTDTLPQDVTFVSATPDQGSCTETGGRVTCELDSLPDQASVSIVIVVTTTQVGILTNTASVVSDTTDPTTGNNSATERTTVLPEGRTTCLNDVLISNYQTTSPQFVEVANVGSGPIALDECSLVFFNLFAEQSIGSATVDLDGITLDPGQTTQVAISGAPAGPGAVGLFHAPEPPADGTPFSTDNQITGMTYLSNESVFAISHLTKPDHNDIYECIYGGSGQGPFTRPFQPLGDCLPQ